MNLPNEFIVTADWHLRNQRPRCRKDEDWIDTQKKALKQILNVAIEKNCDVFLVGDIFHSANETTFEIIQIVQNFAKELEKYKLSLYVLFGNHDLRFHSSSYIDKSAVGILLQSENIYPISIFENVSAPNFDEEVDCEDKDYLFIHTLCFPDMKSVPPNVNATFAKELLEDYPHPKWIFTGDYHRNFHYEHNGRHVVNPGCLLRQASDMKNYQCGVYFVDTDSEIVEFIPIIDSEELVDDSYIIEEKERDERIGDFVDKLKETEGVSLDFLANVENALLDKSIDDDVKDMIRELMEAR